MLKQKIEELNKPQQQVARAFVPLFVCEHEAKALRGREVGAASGVTALSSRVSLSLSTVCRISSASVPRLAASVGEGTP